jgi:glycyl-tRNA synthetase
VKFVHIQIDKPKLGKALKKDGKVVTDYLEGVNEEDKARLMDEMEKNGRIVVKGENQEIEVTSEFLKFEIQEKTIQEEKYIPSVIEPSFGVGRIIYCIFEHCFKMRENDAQRTYFTFPALIAPVKCSILPLINNPGLNSTA